MNAGAQGPAAAFGAGQGPLIGRDGALAVLHASQTGIVTGFSGSGLTSVLEVTGAGCLANGEFVVTGARAPHARPVPLSYLAGLYVASPHGPAALLRPGAAGLLSDTGGKVAVPLDNLPAYVERIAQEILAAAAGRQPVLLLDDLDAADALSLSVLPLLRRRLGARLIGAGHSPAADTYPSPAFAALVDRLPRPSVVHLAGLDDDDCLRLARTRRATAAPGLVRLIRSALGTGAGLPGLFLGLLDRLPGEHPTVGPPGVPAQRPGLRLPMTHPLVQEMLGRPAAASLIAAAGVTGLRQPDLGPLAAALGIGPDHLAEAIDTLTAEGLLVHRDGLWRSSVPALGATLADIALPPAVTVALAARAWADEAHPRPAPGPAPRSAPGNGQPTDRSGTDPAGTDRAELRADTARRLTELAERAGSALPGMLGLLLDTALGDTAPGRHATRHPAPGALPAALGAELRARLLAAIATALEQAAGARPGPGGRATVDDVTPAGSSGGGPTTGIRHHHRLPEAALLAALCGEDRTALRITAAGTRLLRSAAATAPTADGHRALARLRAVAAAIPAPVTRWQPDPRPRRPHIANPIACATAEALHPLAPATAPVDAASATWQCLLLARRTLAAATDGTQRLWAAAWQGWCEAQPGNGQPGWSCQPLEDPDPPIRGAAIRSLAGWGARSELFAALHGQEVTGPVTAYQMGRWDEVEEAGLRFLAMSASAQLAHPPEHDDLVGAALALLVAVHRGQAGVVRGLLRSLVRTGRGRRPPVVGYALAEAAQGRPGESTAATLDLVHEDLRRERRAGARNGLDLLLFAASRLNAALARRATALALAGELDELAHDLGTPYAHLLAVRLGSPDRHTRPAPVPGGQPRPARADRTATDALPRLRSCLVGPLTQISLGMLGQAQAMVLLAEHLPAGDPEAAELATRAGELLAPLRAGHWLGRAQALMPADRPAVAGIRSRAVAEQVRRLIAEGLTNRQISARLNLGEKSVEGYVTRLLRSYGCANRAELAARPL